MRKFWKKIFVAASLFLGAIALTGCQSVEHNAYIAEQSVSTNIYIDQGTGEKYCLVTMGFVNPSIYDVTQFTLDIELFKNVGTQTSPVWDPVCPKYTDTMDVRLKHGSSALATFSVKIEPEYSVTEYVKLSNFKATAYDNIWGSYIAWWICGIVCAGLGLFFYMLTLIRRHMTKNDLIEGLREHIASSSVFAVFILILCIFPLIFGSWVSALILVGCYLAFILGAGLFTFARGLLTKE